MVTIALVSAILLDSLAAEIAKRSLILAQNHVDRPPALPGCFLIVSPCRKLCWCPIYFITNFHIKLKFVRLPRYHFLFFYLTRTDTHMPWDIENRSSLVRYLLHCFRYRFRGSGSDKNCDIPPTPALFVLSSGQGIDIWGVTVQNESENPGPWEACVYTPTSQVGFSGRRRRGERRGCIDSAQ